MEWFEDLYQSMFDPLCKHLLSLCNSFGITSAIVRDCAQETFTLLWVKQSKLREHQNIKGWLYKTATYKLRDIQKAERIRKRRHAFSLDSEGAEPVLHEAADASELLEDRMEDIISVIGKESYDLPIQYYGDEVSNDELAQRLGITYSTLKSRVWRIIQPLRHKHLAIFLVLMQLMDECQRQ